MGWTTLALPVSRPLLANLIRGLPGKGLQEGLEQRVEELRPSANTRGAGLRCLSGLCGCFLKLSQPGKIQGLVVGADGPAGAKELESAAGVSGRGL